MFNKKQKKKLSQVAPEEENVDSPEVVLHANTTVTENQRQQEQPAPSQNPPRPQTPKKTKSVLTRILPFLGTFSKARTTEVENSELIKFRTIIQEAHDNHRKKKEAKRKKRELKKAKKKETTSWQLWPLRANRSKKKLNGSLNTVLVEGSDGVIRNLDKDPSATLEYDRFLIKKESSIKSNMSADEELYLRYLQQQQSGPTHVAAKRDKDAESKRMERKQRRKLSLFYEGDEVYHHSLSRYWDHKEVSNYLARLDREIRKKYPITFKIQEKMDKIKINRQNTANQKLQNNCYNKCHNGCAKFFRRTTLGQVFRNTPRYYKLTPEIPKRCRRCRYLLVDTLESRWTPLGITFAILFPIFGILCCIANREFVCVVCEEIYVYGDYPSRCKPLDKNNQDSDVDMRAVRKSKRLEII